jgi:hypothetical protein
MDGHDTVEELCQRTAPERSHRVDVWMNGKDDSLDGRRRRWSLWKGNDGQRRQERLSGGRWQSDRSADDRSRPWDSP